MEKDKYNSMKTLNKLIGKWKLTGDVHGQTEYKWLEDGKFLMQDVDIKYGGRKIKGIEIIGHLHKLGEKPSKEI